MPEVKDGKVVYTPEELAAATAQNDATAELRASQVRHDTMRAAAGSFGRLSQIAGEMANAEFSNIQRILTPKGE